MSMRTIGYRVSTGLIALAFLAGGAVDVIGGDKVAEGMQHLGYPMYFATLLGVWKVLGAIAIVVPGFPRLKEWAYAGIFFDLNAAAVSHFASGDAASDLVAPIVFMALLFASWSLRPATRALAPETLPFAGEGQAVQGKPALAH